MLATAEYRQTKAFLTANTERAVSPGLLRQLQDFDFPFDGATVAGYYAPPWVWDYVERIRGTAYQCLKLRSDEICNLEWLGYHTNNQADEGQLMGYDEWIPIMLNDPSPLPNRTSFGVWTLIDQWLTTTGNSYNLIQREPDPQTGKMMPRYIWPLESNNILAVPWERNPSLIAYRYTTPRGVYEFSPYDILHIRTEVPTPYFIWNLYFGKGEFSFCADLIDTETQGLLYQARSFANDGTLGAWFESQGDYAEAFALADRNQFVQQMKQDHQGARNARRIAVLPKGWTQKRLPSQEMDFVNSMNFTREHIANSLGVPLPILTGNYNAEATIEVLTKHFITRCIFPRAKLITQALSKFCRLWQENVRVGFVDLVHELPSEKMDKIKTLAQIPAGINGNEARKILYPHLPETIEGAKYITGSKQTLVDDLINHASPIMAQPATSAHKGSPAPQVTRGAQIEAEERNAQFQEDKRGIPVERLRVRGR